MNLLVEVRTAVKESKILKTTCRFDSNRFSSSLVVGAKKYRELILGDFMIGGMLSLFKTISRETKNQNDLLLQLHAKLQASHSGARPFSRKDARNAIADVLADKSRSASESFDLIIPILNLLPSRERSDIFFENVDRDLGDSDLYWQLFKYVLCHSNASKRHISQIRKSLARYGRIKGTARERTERSIVDGDDERATALCLYDSLDDEVLVYRGFIVSGGNRVRRSSDKNSPLYYRQAEGSGFSYSLDEKIALTFAARAAHNYADNLPKMHTKRTTNLSSFKKCFEHFYRGGHPYVGTYLVPKEKIIFVVTETAEKEIVAQPEDAHLVSYQVLHAEDVYERFVKMFPENFPIPSNVNWDPVEFQEVMRHWEKPHLD